MDNRRPITIELEKTNEGYAVARIEGAPHRHPQTVPAPESTRIQISLAAPKNPPPHDLPSVPVIKMELPEESKISNASPAKASAKQPYTVYPHAQITPLAEQTMTPATVLIKKEEIKTEEKPNGISLSETKRNPLVLPSCAGWFDLNAVHEIEQKALPEYFCGKYPSKTPQVYKEYRNFMVKLYRANPNSYLSATTCRRHLAGDVCSIMRIHAFLEHWGLINFSVDPTMKPYKMSLSRAEALDSKVLVNAGGARQEKFSDPGFSQPVSALDPASLLVLNNTAVATKGKRPTCDFCGETCGFVWFVHKAGPKLVQAGKEDPFATYTITLCESCFDKENFPRALAKADFEIRSIRTELGEPASVWTNEETLSLVNAIEKHQGDWNKVVEELKAEGRTRTKTDCILRFMSLPIGESQSAKIISPATADPGVKRPADSCFYDVSNPILMQIGLFAKELERYTGDSDEGKRKHNLRHAGAKAEAAGEEVKSEEVSSMPAMLSKEVVGKIREKSIKRAKKLARKEKEEIRKLVGLILETQMKKLECKMEFFNEFDSLLQNERQQVKALQSQLFADRINLSMNKSDLLGPSGRHRSFDATRKGSSAGDPAIKVPMSPSKPPVQAQPSSPILPPMSAEHSKPT